MADKESIVLHAHCHCKSFSHKFVFPTCTKSFSLFVCHCSRCRHSFGSLFSSSLELNGGTIKIPYSEPVDQATLGKLKHYPFSEKAKGYFCGTCGAAVFVDYGGGWLLGSGLVDSWPEAPQRTRVNHFIGEESTIDGGLGATFGRGMKNRKMTDADLDALVTKSLEHAKSLTSKQSEQLPFTCRCGSIKGYVTRPLPPKESDNPKVAMFLNLIKNKYTSGVCGCTSCRTTSGLEYTTWTFVPIDNIFINSDNGTGSPHVLKFDDRSNLPSALQEYTSTPDDVYRNFCGTCSATIFFRKNSRPGPPFVMDIAAGLFTSEAGARAEDWLAWFAKPTGPDPDATDVAFAKRVWSGLKDWEKKALRKEDFHEGKDVLLKG